ncbi:MAG: hypothetical protein ACRDQF_01600 [Thermocrispum sp.]
MDNGFVAVEETLDGAASRLRSAATYLDLDAAGPEVVDAGFSSDVLNSAIARVGKARLVLAQMAESTADKVNAAKGSYGEIDNDQAGVMTYLHNRVEPETKTSLAPSRMETPDPGYHTHAADLPWGKGLAYPFEPQ